MIKLPMVIMLFYLNLKKKNEFKSKNKIQKIKRKEL
ncbi:hypothetical protein CJE1446 [Campylobacter jejuni RM1221]|nr:hypothetical protein CJE0596 [Campylobacter jejuni RM1221]AHN82829.1 hypothetical protein 00-0949CJIE4_4 [Campylobacter phage CJIE4-1]AHN82887.1 hypothetical protein 00-1597CJIE4_3 [Campylobacter phage CJIE4-2]AHN82944.1 hypothetical protein 00-2425CJIE4_3 [Campylobacter phage CJIE4-3]AHN83002.1 hypothetical protein 00-6200CJIE4_3 [Campylobacter phage CJIE4-4]AHN83062.1 hypothetical protein 01-1512CJIE4_6 [Campylobacter phage CJIE4-5]